MKIDDLEEEFVLTNRVSISSLHLLLRNLSEASDCDSVDTIKVLFLARQYLLEGKLPTDVKELDPLYALLPKAFENSTVLCQDCADYNFFMGLFVQVAEWLYGINDDDKIFEDRLASKMLTKARDFNNSNELYIWAIAFSKGNSTDYQKLAPSILKNSAHIDWLQDYGIAGEYVVETLKFSLTYSPE